MIFYVTFGQQSPFRNGYVKVHAASEFEARVDVESRIGATFYSRIIPESEIDMSYLNDHFPQGQIGEIR